MVDEVLCHIEFFKTDDGYIARMTSELGGRREYYAPSFDDVLDQVMIELQQEFESMM